MPAKQEPATLRRRLQRELRSYRNAAGLTQRDVADAMEWSPSKLIRIESGQVAVAAVDLRALLSHYGVTDRDTVEDLVTVARSARKQSWAEYRDVISQQAATFFDYEADCSVLRQYTSMLVPGLLQTEEYMRSVFRYALLGDVQVDRLVEARLARQELLERAAPPELFFMLDEGVLRRQVGNPTTMRRQLDRLGELGSRKNISVQVVPFGAGSYPGLLGPFVILEFEADDTLLYLESRVETVTRDDPEETGRLLDAFQDMERRLATPSDDLPDVLARIQGGEILEV